MKKENEKVYNHYENSAGELPTLSINLSEHKGEFCTQQISLSSCGWSIKDCKEGLDYLVLKLKEVKIKND